MCPECKRAHRLRNIDKYRAYGREYRYRRGSKPRHRPTPEEKRLTRRRASLKYSRSEHGRIMQAKAKGRRSTPAKFRIWHEDLLDHYPPEYRSRLAMVLTQRRPQTSFARGMLRRWLSRQLKWRFRDMIRQETGCRSGGRKSHTYIRARPLPERPIAAPVEIEPLSYDLPPMPTRRHWIVCQCLARGMTRAQTAVALGLSATMVTNYCKEIREEFERAGVTP